MGFQDFTVDDYRVMDRIISVSRLSYEQSNKIAESLIYNKNVLDLGIGLGNAAKAILGYGNHVHGIDTNPNAIEYVKTKLGKNGRITYEVADAKNLRYNNIFDGVSCQSNFGPIGEREKVFDGVRIALKKGGAFSFTEQVPKMIEEFIRMLGEDQRRIISQGHMIGHEMNFNIALKKIHECSKNRKSEKIPKPDDFVALSRNYGFSVRDFRTILDGTMYNLVLEKTEN